MSSALRQSVNGARTLNDSEQMENIEASGNFLDRLHRRLLPGRARLEIWSRIGLLFGALCLIKLTILVVLRKPLFESHWRIAGQDIDWTNDAAFYLFVLLAGLNLWAMGTRCMAAGKRAVREANACVLVLGALFILLTFHNADKNYLALARKFGWQDIGPFLILNFFFRPPLLAAWLSGYALIYYGLARTGREHLVVRVTAICAVAYLALNLQELQEYRGTLIAVDCIGLACFVAIHAGKRSLPLAAVFLPAFLAGSLFIFFRGLDGKLDKLDPEFVILFGTSVVLFVGMTVLARQRGFYSGWSWFAPFAFSAFLLLINTNYVMAANYRNLLFQGLTLPRYFLGAFGVSGALLLLALCYSYWRPAASLWWLDLIILLTIALALLDFRLLQIMGVRLDWQVLKFGDDPKMIWRMARPYLPSAFLLLLGMAALYASALWGLKRWRQRVEKRLESGKWSGGLYLALLFLLLGLAGRWLVIADKALGETVVQLVKTSPLWKRTASRPMSRETFISTAQQLGLQQLVTPVFPNYSLPPRDLNVVLIFQESSYNKYLSLFDGKEETQPLLSKYKDRMELFPNFFSNFAGSIWARFAAFSGLYPAQDFNEFTANHVNVKSIFDILHENGYDCSIFYSSSFDYTGFRDFLRGRGFDQMYDADTMPGQRKTAPVSWGLREEETLPAIREQIKKHAAANQKFFITYVPAAPHYPFDAIPDGFRKFRMGEPGDYSPLYLNELLYMDWVIASILDDLKGSGLLDKTLVVITSDHGEMLGVDGGPIGHGWAVTPELENIPLIIMDPEKRGYRLNKAIGSQVDLLPTVLDILRIPVPTNQLYEGTSLYLTNDINRLDYLNSFSQYIVGHNRELIWGDRAAKSGADAGDSVKVFAITNNGAHTFFEESHPSEAPKLFMRRFDQFQENFLQNYSRYCEMMQPHEVGGRAASK